MRRFAGLLVALMIAAPVCSACMPAETPATAPISTIVPPVVSTILPEIATPLIRTAQPEETAGPGTIATPTFEAVDPIDQAITALAAMLGVPAADIQLIEAVPVQWSDSSLGCPQPGLAYLPVITPGYLVRLASGDQTYNVHTDLAGTSVVCFNPGDPIGVETVPDPIVAEFIMQAREDLAQRLGIGPEEIALARSEAVEWSDSSLGCHQEGEDYVQAVTTGYRIVLAVGETRYEYHTDQQRMILCENPTQ